MEPGSAGMKKPDIEQANSQGLAIERGADGKQNIYYAVTSKDWTAPGEFKAFIARGLQVQK